MRKIKAKIFVVGFHVAVVCLSVPGLAVIGLGMALMLPTVGLVLLEKKIGRGLGLIYQPFLSKWF